MRRLTVILALACLAVLLAEDPPAGEVVGPVTYTSSGVKLGDRSVSWRAIKSLTETDPDPKALDAEYQKRAASLKPTAATHVSLGKWCREHGLEEQARKEFQAAIALEPDEAVARRALSFVKEKEGWRPAAEVFGEKLVALDRKKKGAELELAHWCHEYALFDEEWKLLVELLVKDAWDREAIQRIKPIVDRRVPKTALRPPFTGRWKALVDSTGHHQIKCFAIYAIDFVKVDSRGSMYTDKGTKLEDFYGYDQEILAAADGVVSMVDDHFPDCPVGIIGKFAEANFVSIEHEGGEHTDYGHIHQGSAKVKVGDHVKKGQVIAHVGSSGAAGLPHLHFTMSMGVFAPGYDHGQWLAIPYRFGGFQVLEANGAPCSFDVVSARPREGWVMQCPPP